MTFIDVTAPDAGRYQRTTKKFFKNVNYSFQEKTWEILQRKFQKQHKHFVILKDNFVWNKKNNHWLTSNPSYAQMNLLIVQIYI